MISIKKWPVVLLGSILSLALWTFISINTSVFMTKLVSDEEFEYFTYITSYVLVIGFWVFVVLKLEISEGLYRVLSVILFLLAPFFCMQIAMMLSGAAEYSFKIYFINVMFYASVMALFLVVFRRFAPSAIMTVILGYAFNMVSFIVNVLRGTPLIPSDILAMGTAAQVAENYTFEMRYPIIAATVTAALVVVMTAKFSHTPKFKFRNLLLPMFGLVFAGIFFGKLSEIDYSNNKMDVFDQYHANNTHGTAYSFYINVRKMLLQKPEGYNEEEISAFLASYSGGEALEYMERPNIIAIMNESFADLKTVGEFETDVEYMSFIDDMTKNTIKGQLLVSPFGGYTCNTEFEFLTSLSMGLLPSGSAPYLQYMSKPYRYSLPKHLKEYGYKTIALHPYLARCWNRPAVYDFLGFDEFISIEKLPELIPEDDWEYCRFYVSDRTSFNAIEKCLENKEADERLFVFNVTMQNHGGYAVNDIAFPTVRITDMEGQYNEAEQYLSLVRESDKAFGELVEYLKSFEEPTVVVMFGDHQPAVEQAFFEELYGMPISRLSLEELQKRYRVPFVIWANYDIESQTDVHTSTNYLPDVVLDAAGLPKNEIGSFTSQLRDMIPQINAMGHFDVEGIWHENNTDDLKQYSFVEYYALKNNEQ